jgi:hypothetical protein
MDAIVYLVLYRGQGSGDTYKHCCYNWSEAEETLQELEQAEPDREWYICEKDVS